MGANGSVMCNRHVLYVFYEDENEKKKEHFR